MRCRTEPDRSDLSAGHKFHTVRWPVGCATQDTVPPKLRLSKKLASEFFRGQDMTHDPDINNAGPDVLLNYGDRGVNRFLGNFSKQERAALKAWLRAQDLDSVINVKITPETGPTQDAPKEP